MRLGRSASVSCPRVDRFQLRLADRLPRNSIGSICMHHRVSDHYILASFVLVNLRGLLIVGFVGFDFFFSAQVQDKDQCGLILLLQRHGADAGRPGLQPHRERRT